MLASLKCHRQMCLVHEIDKRIICKKSYGQSVAMISLHDIPIHFSEYRGYESYDELQHYYHKQSLNGFTNNKRSETSQDFTCTFAHRSDKDHVFKIRHFS